MFIKCKCIVCKKQYEKTVGGNSRSICYDCALEEITGGHAPEEGDFNSAKLISGEISNIDLEYLMKNLRSVELGQSASEPYYEESSEDWEDPAWCYTCNKDTAFCMCNCPECGLSWNLCECE